MRSASGPGRDALTHEEVEALEGQSVYFHDAVLRTVGFPRGAPR